MVGAKTIAGMPRARSAFVNVRVLKDVLLPTPAGLIMTAPSTAPAVVFFKCACPVLGTRVRKPNGNVTLLVFTGLEYKRFIRLLDNLRTGKAKRSGARRWTAVYLVQQTNPAKNVATLHLRKSILRSPLRIRFTVEKHARRTANLDLMH